MEKYNWSLEKIYKNVDEARAEIKLCDEYVERLTKEEKTVKTDELKVLNKSIVINVQLEFINVKIEYTD